MDSQKWASGEEDVTEGDLGLGKIAQLDICTGTAVCRAGDKALGRSVDTQEGAEVIFTFVLISLLLSVPVISNCKMHHVTAESSDDDHLTMEDLICYSFQVAKGMEFLSSRKVKTNYLVISVCACRHPNYS